MLRYVQIQTTSRCNADCVFCPYVESWHADHPGQMTDALWTKLLHDLEPFEAGLSQGMVAPYLMNEPLLDPKIGPRISSIYASFPKTMVQIATNGSALTEKRVDELLTRLEGHKHQIWVSFHATRPDHLRAIMRLDFERALANIRYLLRAADGQFRILLRGSGTQKSKATTWFSADDYRAFWLAEFEAHALKTEKVHVDAFAFHDRAGTLRRTDRGANALNQGVVRQIDPDHPFDCPRLDQWLHVLWDGRIRLCCMDYHGEVELPSLADSSIQAYLASAIYRQTCETVRGASPSPDGFICTRCTSPGG